MRLTVFGNNATCPEADGACACYLLEAAGKKILLDLGDASLAKLQQKIDLAEIDLILISHWHFDHMGDLFCAKYQLETRAANGEAMRPILLAGPAAPPWAMAELGSGGVFEFCPLEAGRETTLQGVKVQPFALPHLIESYGLRLRAEGKTFAYSGDTGATDEVQALARGADLFLCEASLRNEQTAEQGHHLCAGMAGRFAARAGARRLVLTHYPASHAAAILAQARQQYPAAVLSRIFESYEIG